MSSTEEPAAPLRPLAAAILTGGRAARMGGLRKATLAVGGTSIIDRQLAVLRTLAAPVFLVTSAQAPRDAELTVVRDELQRRRASAVPAAASNARERRIQAGCRTPSRNRHRFDVRLVQAVLEPGTIGSF